MPIWVKLENMNSFSLVLRFMWTYNFGDFVSSLSLVFVFEELQTYDSSFLFLWFVGSLTGFGTGFVNQVSIFLNGFMISMHARVSFFFFSISFLLTRLAF